MTDKGFVRRVVTGHDENGIAIVLSDGLTPTVKTNPLRPGHRSTEVWRTSATPVPISADEPDPTVDGPDPVRPAGRRVRRGATASLQNLRT